MKQLPESSLDVRKVSSWGGEGIVLAICTGKHLRLSFIALSELAEIDFVFVVEKIYAAAFALKLLCLFCCLCSGY